MDFSFFELLVVGLIAFLVLGPKELVIWAEKAGALVRKIRMEANRIKDLARQEIMAEDMREIEKELMQARQSIEELKHKVDRRDTSNESHHDDYHHDDHEHYEEDYISEDHANHKDESIEIAPVLEAEHSTTPGDDEHDKK